MHWMSDSSPSKQRTLLFSLAGGMLVVAAGLAGSYYVLGSRGVADAATPAAAPANEPVAPAKASSEVTSLLASRVEIKAGAQSATVTWADLGVELDVDEAGRAGGKNLDELAAKGSLPLRVDRERAVKALRELKGKTDQAPINAYLNLEARVVNPDRPGLGVDIYGSLPRLAAAARQHAKTVELAMTPIPAAVTAQGLGIDDISHVMGHYLTKFPVSDRDRNFNLKLAASKLNGVVLKPGEEWSFNDTVGERSQKNGYKVAHVITAGEMVDGLAGGTCQISTTLFGAAFFAGIDIVKTINHSRPSAYTPLGFDATVVWPHTDLKLKNPYDFPVVVHYVVANGEAKVEILGKERPYDKIVFTREVLEETPYMTEERLDEEIAEGETSYDQEGFPGYKLERKREFYKGKKLVKTNKWTLNYKPVTEYIRRGTSTAVDAKKAPVKEAHPLEKPKNTKFALAQ